MEHYGNSVSGVDLGKTQITPLIRVSSAAIYRHDRCGERWLVETWAFSDDPRQGSFQVVHGSTCAAKIGDERQPPTGPVVEKAQKIHRYIADGLKAKWGKKDEV